MTVKELKEILDTTDENAEIHIVSGDMNGNSFLDAYEVELRKNEVRIFTYPRE